MRLIRGAPGTGKTALVFDAFSQAVRNGETSLRIVVPTATLVRHYQHELARTGLVFDPNMVVSLSRFARECAPNLALAPTGLVRALTRAALSRLQLPEFAQVAETPGMADIVIETITRFENAGCTPDRLSKDRKLSPLGKAFHRVWKEVETAIAERNFATRGQVIRQAATSVPTTKIWIDGFLRFSPLESDFLRAIAAACDVTLTLTDGPVTFDAYRFAMELGARDHLLPGRPRHPQTIAVQAPSPEREADEIARRILELHAEGTDFPDIAVALRDVEAWLPLLRTTFDHFGIPARAYFSSPVAKHPVAIFLSGLIACALKDWDFADTLTALRAHPAWGHNADFDRFDFKVREAMPNRGAEALLSLCDSDVLRGRLADCLKVTAWRHETMPPDLWRRRFHQLAETLYTIRTVAEPDDYAAIETARSHAAGLRAWSAALDTAVHFWSDATPVSLERFHTVVADALDAAGMQIPDDRHNVVHIMSAFEARQWQVKTLFVCGMTARDYPRRAPENLLFPDNELERLRRARVGQSGESIPLRTSADEDRDEELLFESLKTRASENLILTVATRDSGGNTQVPSRHFTEASLITKAPPCKVAVLTPLAEPGRAGHIGESLLPALTAYHQSIALTALEDLAKCRFRFFSGRTLALKPVPDRPEERLSPSATGLIIHEAMEHWLSDRTRDFVALFETTFDEFCRKKNIQPGYKLEVNRIQFRRVAQKVNESVSWPLVSSEMEVDCAFDLPDGVKVTCRVDRIDTLVNDDCIIIDYKSGKTANVKKLVERETSLQGPLYALAVRDTKHLNPIAMGFLAVRESKIFGWGKIPGPVDHDLSPIPPDWIESARDRTIARLRNFLAGDVHAEPTHPDDCIWCDYKHACRIETEQPEPRTITIGATV
jgi:ATP-dependent helicase/DNAse subunit B